MIKNYVQFLKEQKAEINRKYYIFDWDDNILEMPTKIYLQDKNKDEVIAVSTKDFVDYRNDDNYNYVDNSFVEFKDSGKRGEKAFLLDTIEALTDKNYANSWSDFMECLRNGSLFAIVTARGHNPETLKKGVRYIIEKVLSEKDYQEMISNLLSFKKFYDEKKLTKVDEKKLITEYLNKCGFYPINNEKIYRKFEMNPLDNQEELKLACINDFMAQVKKWALIDKTDHWNYEANIKISIGFSDDDYKNVATVAKYGKNLSVYHTKDSKQKINI